MIITPSSMLHKGLSSLVPSCTHYHGNLEASGDFLAGCADLACRESCTPIEFKYTVTLSNNSEISDVWCVCKEITVLVVCHWWLPSFFVAKLNYKSRSTLLKHGMNVWKGLCMKKCVRYIPTQKKAYVIHTNVWQWVWERTMYSDISPLAVHN